MTLLNIVETIDQSIGSETLFLQVSRMTRQQIFYYCLILSSFFAAITLLIINFMLNNKRQQAVIASTLGWCGVIVMFIIEKMTRFSV